MNDLGGGVKMRLNESRLGEEFYNEHMKNMKTLISK
jgi:hypothetical protein